MPEGDTVHRLVRKMHAATAGAEVLATDLRVPRHATASLNGRTIDAWQARGKHLLTRFSGGLTLHTHLRMDGSWRLADHDRPWPERDWRIRVALDTQTARLLGWSLGVVELLRTADEHRVVGHLGPDLLGPDWDPARALANLRAAPERPLPAALLDQRVLAGIGNVYAVELTFLFGASPWTPVGDVADLDGLVARAATLLQANVDTGIQTTTGDPRPLSRHWVYGRAGRPCRRCATPVAAVGPQTSPTARDVWWCPRCQPGAPDGVTRRRQPRESRPASKRLR